MAKATIKKKNPKLDLYIIHKDTECTYGKVEDTRFFAFNPCDKNVNHNQDWPGLGFECKEAVDGVIKRLQAISADFDK